MDGPDLNLLRQFMNSGLSWQNVMSELPGRFQAPVPNRPGDLLDRDWNPDDLLERACAVSFSDEDLCDILPTGYEWDDKARQHFAERFRLVQHCREEVPPCPCKR